MKGILIKKLRRENRAIVKRKAYVNRNFRNMN